MQAHMDRFRVRLSTHSTAASPPKSFKPPAIPGASEGTVRITACDRCRHFKKKCSKTPPECASCVAAGLKCSLATITSTNPADLRSRLAWMENFINQRHLLGRDHAIEHIATGTDLSELADQQTGSVGVSPASTSVDGLGTRDASFRSGRPLDDESTIIENSSNDGPSPKRRRLDGSISGDDSRDNRAVQHRPERAHDQLGRIFVDAYFRDVNRAYPFVDRARIMSTLNSKGGRVFSIKQQRDTDSTMLYLVMAIGYTTLQRAGQVPVNADTNFEVEYKDILAECLVPESTDTVQILLLLAIYSVSDPRGFSTRPIVDMLARQAIRLGLTRRDLADEGLLPAEAERNHRLFWSIYVIDRMIAASTGMACALNDVNMNMPLPGITVDEFASPDCMEYTTMLQTARHVIQLRKLEDKVLHRIHLRDRIATTSLTQLDRRAIAMSLRTEIEDWYSNGCLLKSAEVDDVRIHITISWLAARYYNLLLLLYYPSHFNPTSSLLSKAELASLAQKHVQANAVRFQHRQLPLNHITLCRLLPVCMIFLHCFLCRGPNDPPLNIREEVSICADMMEAFPAHWAQAHRAAAIVRQLASLVSNSLTYDPVRFTSTHAWSRSESDRAWCHAIKLNLTELAEQIIGKGSAYRLLEEGEDPGVAGVVERSLPNGPLPVGPQQIPGLGEPVSNRGPLPAESSYGLEPPIHDGDVTDNGFSIMDFL